MAYGGPGNLAKSYIFRSYDHKAPVNPELAYSSRLYNYGPASAAKLWKVARATSAAPGYFSEQRIDGAPYEDGGRGLNNPALHVFEDVEKKHSGRYPELIVTVGTGTKAESSESSMPEEPAQETSSSNPMRHLIGLIKIATKGLPDDITDTEEAHERLEHKIYGFRKGRQKQDPEITHPLYFRFNVKLLGAKVKLDEWKPSKSGPKPNGDETLGKLSDLTNEYLKDEKVRQALKDCAVKLVHIRRKRAETERWEQFATQYFYNCNRNDTCGGDHFFKSQRLSTTRSRRPRTDRAPGFVGWWYLRKRRVPT